MNLSVRRSDATPPIPLNAANRIEEGDEIIYSPVLRPKEKRSGKVALVLIASQPQENPFEILEPHDADEPAKWKAPFNVALSMFVYGPSGLSTRKLKVFLNKDQELVSQLAEYA